MAGPAVDTVRTLLQLASLDDELRVVRDELTSSPQKLSDCEAVEEELAERYAGVELVCAAEEKRCRACETELATIEKRIERANTRLANLVSEDQINATQRELSSLREQSGVLEEKALVAMERIDSLQVDRDRILGELEKARAEVQGLRAEWAERQPVLQSRADELGGFREKLQAELNGEQRRLYSTALGRGAHGASPAAGITLVDGFICRTCHKRLPPMWVNESRVWARLYCCDGCKRILVFDPDDDGL